MAPCDYDVVILGSGPGGYVAGIRAAQLGKTVAVIEQEKIGGVCLNVGCIPTKSLINQASIYRSQAALRSMGMTIDASGFDFSLVQAVSSKAADTLSKGVAYLLKKNKITVLQGRGRLVSDHEVEIDGNRRVFGGNIIIATGSQPRTLPGFDFDGRIILSSTDILAMRTLPKKLLILGAGAIGVEFAYIMNAFGVEVHLAEMLDHVLPAEEAETAEVLRKSFIRRGVSVYTGVKAVELVKENDCAAAVFVRSDGTTFGLTVDRVLVVTGRTPCTGDIGLEALGVVTEKGFVVTGDYGETSCKGVYAIGDAVATPLLAHVASKEGEIAAERIAGKATEARLDLSEIPFAVYCDPQIARFGPAEQNIKAAGAACNAACFPFRGIGKAVAIGETDGFVKVLYDPDKETLLGATIVGAGATELIHELLLAKRNKIPLCAIADMVHAHPTLSEGIMEAARAALNRAIHI